MPQPLVRYNLDPTGVNPDNFVADEIHTLGTTAVRALAPEYGAFFTTNLVVRDHVTNAVLARGTDYQCVELLQQATVRYGKEICLLILILNQSVSTQVRISYQVLGGNHQNNSAELVPLYNAVINDNRSVNWVDVLNKPLTYPPSLHNHLLEDIYGFEDVVVQLERLGNAITLTNIPAFEALIEWVKNRGKNVVSEAEIDAVLPVDKLLTFERLQYAIRKLNFNAITLNPEQTAIGNNSTLKVNFFSTNMDENETLYWTVEHITTDNADFNTLNGILHINANKASFNVQSSSTITEEPEEEFYIAIRRNSILGPVIARTGVLKIRMFTEFLKYFNTCCINTPGLQLNPRSLFVVGAKVYQ